MRCVDVCDFCGWQWADSIYSFVGPVLRCLCLKTMVSVHLPVLYICERELVDQPADNFWRSVERELCNISGIHAVERIYF